MLLDHQDCMIIYLIIVLLKKYLPGLNLAAGEDIEQAALLNGWERSRRPFPDEQFPFPAAKRAVDKLKRGRPQICCNILRAFLRHS